MNLLLFTEPILQHSAVLSSKFFSVHVSTILQGLKIQYLPDCYSCTQPDKMLRGKLQWTSIKFRGNNNNNNPSHPCIILISGMQTTSRIQLHPPQRDVSNLIFLFLFFYFNHPNYFPCAHIMEWDAHATGSLRAITGLPQ